MRHGTRGRNRLFAIACALCLSLAAPAAADFDNGLSAFLDGDYRRAREIWLALAGSGDAQSQFGLGMIFEGGRGVPPDAEKISLNLKTSSPAETGSMTVYNSDGKEIGRGDTTKAERFELNAEVAPPHRGKAWSVHLGDTPAGNVEDLELVLGPGCGEFLATDPARLIVPTE